MSFFGNRKRVNIAAIRFACVCPTFERTAGVDSLRVSSALLVELVADNKYVVRSALGRANLAAIFLRPHHTPFRLGGKTVTYPGMSPRVLPQRQLLQTFFLKVSRDYATLVYPTNSLPSRYLPVS